jgi:flagellar protein FlaG
MTISPVSGHNPGVEPVINPTPPHGIDRPEGAEHSEKAVQRQSPQREVKAEKNEKIAVQELEGQSLDKAVEQLNAVLASMDRYVRFSVDKPSGRTVVKVIDNRNDEVIKQIPPDAILSLSAKIKELIGILFDKRS